MKPLIAVVLFLTSLVVGLGTLLSVKSTHEYQRAVLLDAKYEETVAPKLAKTEVRSVYPRSLIAGGVRSVEEFHVLVAKDPVLSAWFQQFNWNAARTCTLPKGRYFVTEREGNVIVWSKLPIEKGEQSCITDGVTSILVKCGNEVQFSNQETGDATLPPIEFTAPHYEEIEVPKLTPAVTTSVNGAPVPTVSVPVHHWLGFVDGGIVAGGIIPILHNHSPEPPPQHCTDPIEFGLSCD